jgi:Kef-type K+ transport system membrane component KefB
LLLPHVQQQVFAPGIPMDILYVGGQVGLVLHMFLLGVEFETHLTRQHVRSVVVVSLAGLLMSLLLGSLVAGWLIGQPGLFNSRVLPWEAMLFLGTALAITAFPMLTRLLVGHGLATTPLGTLVIAAGSSGDAVSWGILVVVLALFKGSATLALLTVAGGMGYTLMTLTVGRSLLRPLGKLTEKHEGITQAMLAIVFVLVMGCAWLTDTIGISAGFGGFILGLAMPRGFFARRLRFLLRPLVTYFLLPLYFVVSGLHTNIGLLNTWLLWGIAALILASAVTGKGIACWLVARISGKTHREALAIGSLMNARGLMELILLNVGLQMGLITPTLFTMLVIMALVTTFMTSPLFAFVYGRFRPKNLHEDVLSRGFALD